MLPALSCLLPYLYFVLNLPWPCFLFFFFFFQIYFFLAALGLHCCTCVFCSYGRWRLLSSHLSLRWHLLLQSMVSRCVGLVAPRKPGPGVEPVSPALAGRFFATRSSGKPHSLSLLILLWCCVGLSSSRWPYWTGHEPPHPGSCSLGVEKNFTGKSLFPASNKWLLMTMTIKHQHQSIWHEYTLRTSF